MPTLQIHTPNLSPVYKTTTYFHQIHLRTVYHYYCSILRLVCNHPYPTFLPGGTGKKKLRIGGHALVSGCLEHWSNQP